MVSDGCFCFYAKDQYGGASVIARREWPARNPELRRNSSQDHGSITGHGPWSMEIGSVDSSKRKLLEPAVALAIKNLAIKMVDKTLPRWVYQEQAYRKNVALPMARGEAPNIIVVLALAAYYFYRTPEPIAKLNDGANSYVWMLTSEIEWDGPNGNKVRRRGSDGGWIVMTPPLRAAPRTMVQRVTCTSPIYRRYDDGLITVTHDFLNKAEFTASEEELEACGDRVEYGTLV
ncbi:hypothetical protein V8F20_010506 [Naviculisporaceae sp. PSN 640]